MGIGYFSGRKLGVNMHSLSMLSIYILVPFVVTVSLINIDLKPSYIGVPVFLFALCSLLCIIATKMGRRFLDKDYHPLMPLLGGTSNSGYFGIPVLVALLDPQAIGLYMLFNMGVLMTEVTTSYYLSNRANTNMKESIKRVLKLPPLYGVIAGISLNLMNVDVPDVVNTYWEYTTGAYIIIGMMLIGVGLSKLEGLHVDLKFTSLCFFHKYIIWPATFLAVILFDQHYSQLFNDDIYLMLFLLGICPLPANAVAYAAQLKLHAQETAAAILLTTLFALIYVPSMISLYFLFMNR